jgi:hypothetical protein
MFNVLLDATVSRKNTSSLASAGVVRWVRVGEIRFKQRAEFLLVQKELLTKISRLLKIYMLSVLLIKTLVLVGVYQLQVLRKALCDVSHFQTQTKIQLVEWYLPNSLQNMINATLARGKVMASF